MGAMHPGVRFGAAVFGALVLLTPADAVAADGPPVTPRSHVLAHAGHGAAVLAALGDRLPAAAATNRMSATRLRDILANDETAWVGEDGQLFYVEQAESLAQADATSGVATATYPASQTFALHSLPGSDHTIFLDFDGATVSGTWWNSSNNANPMPSRFYTGFTLDSDPGFSSTELAYIQQVWRIVAEKYAAFDVDVTTEDPGPAGYNRSSSVDPTYGDHVLITDDAGAVDSACGGGCSGIAMVGSFNSTWDSTGYLEPAWVFSSKTWGSAVLTAHTVAHEVGHTFGLHHDGNASTSYYEGQGNWFPLMGSSARGVGQFSKGEYAGANNTEDDLAVIAAGGAPYRADDHPGTISAAEPLAGGTAVDGVISTRSDQDVFAVDHPCATDLTVRATGIEAGASLDMSVRVLRADGSTVAAADPPSGQTSAWPATPTGMDASLTVAAPSGTYYVRVDGVGKGDPATNGYSDYGSIGEYVLGVSACDGTMPPTTIPAAPTPVRAGTTSHTTAPSRPHIRRAISGRRGGRVTAAVRWAAPASSGGAAISGYRIQVERVSRAGRVTRVIGSARAGSRSRAVTLRLHRGHYRFRVIAYNAVGRSPLSAPSRVVRAR
jgi:hypothetical protein